VTTCTEPPGTSMPVASSTIFTVCVPVLPGATIRPKEFKVNGVDPTTRFIPTQPVKLFLSVSGVVDVTNLIPGATTVNNAALLVAVPFTFVTTHRNCVPL